MVGNVDLQHKENIMRTRTYEVKDSTGTVIDSGMMGWWNNQITMAGLAPIQSGGIAGVVSARGGWCKVGQWGSPENPVTLQSSANRWAELVSQFLISTGDNSPAGVINAIASTLEVLEDERLNPPAPEPVVPPPVEE
jgi:hypothetical protein